VPYFEAMRRSLILASLVPAVLLAGLPSAPAANGLPRLGVVQRKPLTIRGTAFKPGERVQVTAAAGAQVGATVVASETGAFTARFRLSAGRCTRVSAIAFGSRGSRARLAMRPAPDCVPSDPSTG
jgi:hypothetical protein